MAIAIVQGGGSGPGYVIVPDGGGGGGNQGTQGVQGSQGNQGIQGVQGPQGRQGFQGIAGTGSQGNQGTQGVQGTQGRQGFQGVTGVGTQGNQGVVGAGSQGTQGILGPGAFFPAMVVPPQTGWTLIGPTGTGGTQTASFAADSTGITLAETGSNGGAGENVRPVVRTAPGTPFTVTALCLFTLTPTVNCNAGIMMRESSTGMMLALAYQGQSNMHFRYAWVDVNTYNSGFGVANINSSVSFPMWMRMSDDGTTITLSLSGDGVNFRPYSTTPRTSPFTVGPDQIGFFYCSGNSNNGFVRLVSWNVT